jgi:Auxin canalisation
MKLGLVPCWSFYWYVWNNHYSFEILNVCKGKEKKKRSLRPTMPSCTKPVSVAAVAAATVASASGFGKDDKVMRTDMAVASAATLVTAQCVEAAEAMVGSAVNVRTPGERGLPFIFFFLMIAN